MLRIMRPAFSLYFDDYRYMGGIDIIPLEGWPLYSRDLGPDLLQHALDEKTWIPLDKWLQIFTQKKWRNREISHVLLEQSTVAGIGNYIKCEVLYYAGVRPDRIVKSITTEEWDQIRTCAHKVVLLSYSCGGFTIKDFISPDWDTGNISGSCIRKDSRSIWQSGYYHNNQRWAYFALGSSLTTLSS